MSASEGDDFLARLRTVATQTRERGAETAADWARLLALFEAIEAHKRLERGEDGFDGY